MVNLAQLYNPQYESVTGRKRKIPATEFILAQLPAMRKRYEDKARYELEEESLEQERGIHDEQMALARKQARESKKQASAATGINLASLGLQTGYLGHKMGWWGEKGTTSGANLATVSGKSGGAAAAPAAESVTTAPVGSNAWNTPAAAGGAGAESASAASTAPSGAGGTSLASPALKTAGVAGMEYGGRKYVNPWAREQAGKTGGVLELTARRAGQGAILGGGWGAVVGGTVGLVEGVLTEGEGACMIVTACTGRESYEVNVAREYRDRFVGAATLRGYYMIAETIVPLMNRWKLLRRLVKRTLVDPLIDHASWALSADDHGVVSERPPNRYTEKVTHVFLKVCHFLGSSRSRFVRSNGETV